MDILEKLSEINNRLNSESSSNIAFKVTQIENLEFSINFNYSAWSSKEGKTIKINFKKLFYTKDLEILPNYDSLDIAHILGREVGYLTLFSIEKELALLNALKSSEKSKGMYILKSNYSQSILMESVIDNFKTYVLKNIQSDLNDNLKFIFNLSEIREIDNNKNIIYDFYIEDLEEVLSKKEDTEFDKDKMYQLSETLYLDSNLFEKEESVDYYNSVTTIKNLVLDYVDAHRNKIDWKDNVLSVNNEFILEFNEKHMAYDLSNVPNEDIQLKLYEVLSSYNGSEHKVYDKYVIINKEKNHFLQSSRTPSGAFNIMPLEPRHISSFDENCIFYLEEIFEKFPENILAELYVANSSLEIIPWDKIDSYQEQLFSQVTDQRYQSIIRNLNSISKLVV